MTKRAGVLESGAADLEEILLGMNGQLRRVSVFKMQKPSAFAAAKTEGFSS